MFQRATRQLLASTAPQQAEKRAATTAIMPFIKPADALVLHHKSSAAAVARKLQTHTMHDPKQMVAFSPDTMTDTTPGQLRKERYRFIMQAATNPAALAKKSTNDKGETVYTITKGDTFDINEAVKVGESSWYGLHHESDNNRSDLFHMALKDAKEYNAAIQYPPHLQFGCRKLILAFDFHKIAEEHGNVIIAHGHALANTHVTVKSTGERKHAGQGGGDQLYMGTAPSEQQEFFNKEERAKLQKTISTSALIAIIPSQKLLINLEHIKDGKYKIKSIRSICPDRNLEPGMSEMTSCTMTEAQMHEEIHGKQNSLAIKMAAPVPAITTFKR